MNRQSEKYNEYQWIFSLIWFHSVHINPAILLRSLGFSSSTIAEFQNLSKVDVKSYDSVWHLAVMVQHTSPPRLSIKKLLQYFTFFVVVIFIYIWQSWNTGGELHTDSIGLKIIFWLKYFELCFFLFSYLLLFELDIMWQNNENNEDLFLRSSYIHEALFAKHALHSVTQKDIRALHALIFLLIVLPMCLSCSTLLRKHGHHESFTSFYFFLSTQQTKGEGPVSL